MKKLVLAAASASIAVMPVATRAAEDITIGAIYLDAQGFYAGVRKGAQVGGAEIGKKCKLSRPMGAATSARRHPSSSG